LAEDLDDAQLEALLFPPLPAITADQRPMPDWARVRRELRRPNVTLALLWEEYRASAPDVFVYSWFCDLYRGWAGRLKPMMRQTHVAGEKLFADFGRTGEITDSAIKRARRATSSPSQSSRLSSQPRQDPAPDARAEDEVVFGTVGAAADFHNKAAQQDFGQHRWRAPRQHSGSRDRTVSDNLKAGIRPRTANPSITGVIAFALVTGASAPRSPPRRLSAAATSSLVLSMKW